MYKSLLFLLLIVSLTTQTIAQENNKRIYRPDLPGSFILEFGFNTAIGSRPKNFSPQFWGSRTFNIYYQHNIRLWNSTFSLNPGIGFSFERFKIDENYTLDRKPDANGVYQLVPTVNLEMKNSDKSMIIMNYLEIPLELRFDTNPDDLKRSFHVAGGMRVGYLFESHTKVNYTMSEEKITHKDKQDHGLSNFRYSLYGKLGIASFNIFGYYNISPLFQPNKGPDTTNMSTLTFGISLSGF